jgi:hypothetical protein
MKWVEGIAFGILIGFGVLVGMLLLTGLGHGEAATGDTTKPVAALTVAAVRVLLITDGEPIVLACTPMVAPAK